MRKILVGSLLLVLSIGSFAQTEVTPLNLKERVLPNGLRVITLADNSSPTVTVHVWYDVGGKDDPAGKSGFAHMFEHMMFKSTKNMPSEMLDRLTEDVGGWNNASTWEDLTNYYEVIPSNYLETLLWAEADRMVNLDIDEKNFDSERDVVKEEYRQRILANPYGQLFQYVDSLSFIKHPYQRGVIGNIDELNAASPADAKKFYNDYYRPDNANLIVVGDFDQKQLDGWIDKYFGRITKPTGAITRVTIKEPARTEVKKFEKQAPNVPLPAVAMTYQAPTSRSADVPALNVAEAILSNGDSSRLYQSLIRTSKLASSVNFYADVRVDSGLLIFFAIGTEGAELKDIEQALLAEIKKIQDAPPSAGEIEKAKNKLLAQILQERETNEGKANQIGRAIIFDGSASAVNSDIAALNAVTAADVQNVMKRYFESNKRVVIYYTNEEQTGDQDGVN